jgi:predicted RNA binding protein YcfA (HicA-like mRNA interferase family)
MPRGLNNWTFTHVARFLKKNGFIEHGSAKGSHFHYKKITKDKSFLVVLAFHGSKSIPRGTMNSIIRQSGIDKNIWENFN